MREREGNAGRGRIAEWAMPISPRDGRERGEAWGALQSLVRAED